MATLLTKMYIIVVTLYDLLRLLITVSNVTWHIISSLFCENFFFFRPRHFLCYFTFLLDGIYIFCLIMQQEIIENYLQKFFLVKQEGILKFVIWMHYRNEKKKW